MKHRVERKGRVRERHAKEPRRKRKSKGNGKENGKGKGINGERMDTHRKGEGKRKG